MDEKDETKLPAATEASAAPAAADVGAVAAAPADAAIDEMINGRPFQLVPLEVPIKRQGGDITELKVMKPLGGDLKGLSLKNLVEMDALSVQVLLPRITVPTLIQAEANNLDLVDLTNCASVVYDFLHPMAVRKAMRT